MVVDHTRAEDAIDRSLNAIKSIASEFTSKSLSFKDRPSIKLDRETWTILNGDIDKTAKVRYIPLSMTGSHDLEIFILPNVVTLMCVADAGYVLDWHNHIVDGYKVESIMVLSGYIKYSLKNNKYIHLQSGDVCRIEPTTEHRFKSVQDSKFIAMFKQV